MTPQLESISLLAGHILLYVFCIILPLVIAAQISLPKLVFSQSVWAFHGTMAVGLSAVLSWGFLGIYTWALVQGLDPGIPLALNTLDVLLPIVIIAAVSIYTAGFLVVQVGKLGEWMEGLSGTAIGVLRTGCTLLVLLVFASGVALVMGMLIPIFAGGRIQEAGVQSEGFSIEALLESNSIPRVSLAFTNILSYVTSLGIGQAIQTLIVIAWLNLICSVPASLFAIYRPARGLRGKGA